MPASPPPITRWTAGAHDQLWRDARNWTAGVPGAGVVARFGRGAALVELATAAEGTPLAAGRVDVFGGTVRLSGGVLRVGHAPFDKQFFGDVGVRVDRGGGLAVAAGASLLDGRTVAIGDSSAGSLNIQGVMSDAQVNAGAGGVASITVEGAGARWQTGGADQSFLLGGAAAATLVIRAGGRVDDGAAWRNADANSTMTIGGSQAGGSALVTDPGSELRFQLIDVGGSYSGTLSIAAGAHVTDLGATVGEMGDGTVSVTGVGSVWSNQDGLFVQGAIPHGSVNVADHARVTFGGEGLQIGGDFSLDATASLVGGVIEMAGGSLSGLATQGLAQSTVTITQTVELGYNPAVSGGNAGNFVGSEAGATLTLAGVVAPQGSQYDPLAVGGGDVVLGNAGNGDFDIALYGGLLEAATAGASGSGPIAFLGSTGATMQFDQTGAVANAILGFGMSAQDIIDLQAVVFTAAPSLSWRQTGAHDGTLRVSDGAHAVSLALDGRYSQSGFATASDGHGGTGVSYHS